MKKLMLTLSISVLLIGCATYRSKYATGYTDAPITVDKEVSHTFFLIGDAGLSPMGDMNNTLKAFKNRLDNAPENSTALFLGDNIYPAGLPDKKDSTIAWLTAKNHLDAQLATLNNFKGNKIFIPGNHDWYNEGLKGLERQEEYIQEVLGSKDVFFPENGCPIEDIEINEDVTLITIDSEWFLVNWDRHPTINDDCDIKDREQFLLELEDKIKDNRDKTTIIALHHPMFTYGSHGGQFSFKQHLKATSKVPLPIFGTLVNVLRRTSGGSIEDQSNKRYNELKKRIVTLAQYSEKVVFVSGHEHTLQYIVEENIPQIVSGSGAKKGYTRLLNGSKFTTGSRGYAIMEVYTDGSSKVDFYGANTTQEQHLFSSLVLPPDRQYFKYEGDLDFPEYVNASVYTEEEVEKTGFFKTLWGERYRKYYATPVKAKTVDLDTLFGGLKPVRKGGGHQSKSLRLEAKDGRQYVMRALKKSAELYLQALAFKNEYVIGEFENTKTEEILADFYTGSHPYAPFTVGELSDAANLFHTNPKLYYIPKQKALEDFNTDFGDELYMIEEHVSEGHDIPSFGYAEKIESTDKLFEKLRKDEEYKLDADSYVRARLFDMLIGDWDRHNDQWRWAQFKQENGDKILKPIPRDRDQVYSIMGDGALMSVATKIIPGLRLFEGFKEEITSVKGFNSSPKTFALDMALLSETTLEQWEEQARFLQKNITEEVINQGLSNFPEEVKDETVAKIKHTLLERKKGLWHTARDYFKVLNKYSVITGTDKDDYFVIQSLPNNKVDVKVYRNKGGQKKDLFFDKLYDPEYTKEIWVYGLDDDDIFEVNGKGGKIKIRLVGGQNNDIYKINEQAKGVHVYDFKTKKNTYDEAFGGHINKINDYDTNSYQFLKIKASTNQLLPAVGFNPDDGVKVGFTNTYTYNGFRQNPFTQQHVLNGAYYFATSGFELGYRGEFQNVLENVNLEVKAQFTSPNFTQNFFGFGNETENLDDDLGLDYNRVKLRTLAVSPSFVWRGPLGSKVRLGSSFEDIEVEESEGRFVNEFYVANGEENKLQFLGIEGEYSYVNTDNEAYPTMGMAFSLVSGYKANITESENTFGYIIPKIAFDHRISSNGQLVLATEFKGHFNIGNGYEFYQGATLGASNGLRGYRFQRFTGKTAYSQKTDLRLSFRKRRTSILPVTPGLFAGFDYGRVWQPNDASGQWHNSYGGGFFLNGSDLISANVSLFNSTDGMRFAFGIGFGF
ncbi:metallophosphoesterase [Croceivirga sp. JEA036]|uniref:metallophosphoesterase n=1 Tax=Croceivirga sp. JEA036 TaxID=2721162 RepID=UPI00143A86D8|nr:metallophosphoesterase [Croceivirga sp. JEA036]NJB36744.1 phosphoesterase [Croceivirga sp. JEA036]